MPVVRQAVWTTPVTWNDAQELDEDTLNEQIRNNLLFLKSGHFSHVTYSIDDALGAYTIDLADGWEDVDATNLVVALTLEVTTNLYLGYTIPIEHSTGAAGTYIDFHDGTNYLSTGTTSPPASGLNGVRVQNNNRVETLSGIVPIGPKAPGLYTYTLRWQTSANTATIDLDKHNCQLWLLGR